MPLIKCRDYLVRANWDIDRAIDLARKELMPSLVNEKHVPTCHEIREKLKELDAQRMVLVRQQQAIERVMADVKKDCTHDSMHPFSAAGVVTNVCDFCKFEVFVRCY